MRDFAAFSGLLQRGKNHLSVAVSMSCGCRTPLGPASALPACNQSPRRGRVPGAQVLEVATMSRRMPFLRSFALIAALFTLTSCDRGESAPDSPFAPPSADLLGLF